LNELEPMDRPNPGTRRRLSLLASRVACFALAGLFLGQVAAAEQTKAGIEEPAASQNWTQRSPVFPETPVSAYFDLKDQVHDASGFGWKVNYSIMVQGRPDNAFDDNYNATGQLDLIGYVDLDFRRFGNNWGQGKVVAFYMHLHQLGGLTTSQFGEQNGNITPINDSDPVSFLRQAYYQHEFFDERVLIQGGKIEPPLIFGINRYAIDDREKFMVLPMSTIGAKDRVGSSPGGLISVKPLPWLSIGGSVNQLSPDDSAEPLPPDLAQAEIYAFANLTFDFEVPYLGRGIYRINGIFTAAQGNNPGTQGIALSFDQDLGSQWGAFLRYDDTEFQTLTSPLSETISFGFFNRTPFGREADRFGVGAFRSLSTEGGDFDEWGAAKFYKLGLTRWLDISVNLQVIDAAKSGDTFVTLGGRFFFKF